MINRKCNCENEVSSRKLTVLKKVLSGKEAHAKKIVQPSMMQLSAIVDTPERTPALKLHLTGTEFT